MPRLDEGSRLRAITVMIGNLWVLESILLGASKPDMGEQN